MDQKRCFVIAPIGDDDSTTRRRSGQILAHLIRPIASKFGYDVIAADGIAEPGIISTQLVHHLLNDALVIADLTGRNPNVYYELAVRHATRKPVIQLIEKGEPLPFDVAGTRTIVVDHRDLDSVEEARKDLARYIENVENAAPGSFDSPISLALDIETLRQSNDPQQAGLADVVERMTGVQGTVLAIERAVDTRLTHRLNQIYRITIDLKEHLSKGDNADAVSDLNESIEDLRRRLNKAISKILDDIQFQNAQLALRIQSVFEEQSLTATDGVERSFAETLAITIADKTDRERLLKSLVEVFMHGMSSMGRYQQINVTEQTQTTTQSIRERINESIEHVFLGIDKIQEQLTALPSLPGPQSNAAEA